MTIKSIPKELTDLSQWVVWRLEGKNGKATKVPLRPDNLHRASTTDHTSWSDFDSAVQCAEEQPTVSGVGFVFSPSDGLVGIDLDKCCDPDTGEIDRWATDIIKRLDSYTEISPSGTGVHIIVRGKLIGAKRRKGHFEVYDRSRYFCTTGDHINGTPYTVNDRNNVLAEVCAEMFGQNEKHESGTGAPSTSDDDEIIARAKAAHNGTKFSSLWSGDTSGYQSQSEADLALCGLLASQTGADTDRIDRLFRKSGLNREKWENREDYRERTINEALNGRSKSGSQQVQFALTDTGNAERLVARHGHDFRFCTARGGDNEAGSFHIYTGARWEPDRTFQVARFAKETLRSMYADAANIENDEERKALLKHIRNSESHHRRSAMTALAKKEPGIAIQPNAFDADIWLFNCLNGTIDLQTGKLREHRREDLITKLAPVRYDPTGKCPRFLKFLDEIMIGNESLILWLQRFLGMCLTGDIREQVFPIFHGDGQNGKSVLIDTIKFVMGDYAADAPPELVETKQHSGHPTEIDDLRGRRLVIASETEAARKLRVPLVKRMTGDATLKGRHMREDFFEFPRTHKTILITNNKPVICESKAAIWRRIRLVPFAYTVPDAKVEKRLIEFLRAEAPGILRWLVEGCVAWQRGGLPEVAEIEVATAEYRAEQDVLTDFLEAYCILDPDGKVTRSSIFETYSDYASRNHERCPLNRVELYDRLRQRGLADCEFRVGGKTQRGFAGICLKSEEQSHA